MVSGTFVCPQPGLRHSRELTVRNSATIRVDGRSGSVQKSLLAGLFILLSLVAFLYLTYSPMQLVENMSISPRGDSLAVHINTWRSLKFGFELKFSQDYSTRIFSLDPQCSADVIPRGVRPIDLSGDSLVSPFGMWKMPNSVPQWKWPVPPKRVTFLAGGRLIGFENADRFGVVSVDGVELWSRGKSDESGSTVGWVGGYAGHHARDGGGWDVPVCSAELECGESHGAGAGADV